MNKNKIISYGFIISLISVLVIIGIFISIPKPIEPMNPTYPNADITTVQYYNGSGTITTNPEYLRQGFHGSDGVYEEREWYRTYIQFDISNIRYEWKSCVFSVYQSSINDYYGIGKYGIRLWLNSSWDEETPASNINIDIDDWEFLYQTEHITYNISDHIRYAKNITIAIYTQNAHLTQDDYNKDAFFEMYSRDSNIDNKYKPQLIWS